MASAQGSSEGCIEILVNQDGKLLLKNTKEIISTAPEPIASTLKDLHDKKGLKKLEMKPEVVNMEQRLQIDDILNTFTSCSFLVELTFSDIRLVENKIIFGDMPLLKSLTFKSCNRRLLNSSVGRLKSLEYLSIYNNRYSDLPFSLRFLENLSHIDISLNLFRSLPGCLFHLKNLKTITGLHNNLFDQNPKWNKEENLNIISIPPLKKMLEAKNENSTSGQVPTLSSIAIENAVGFNIWAIPLPDKYRYQITGRMGQFALCESCLKPIPNINKFQETTGHLIKMCMAVFLGTRNVPFRFYTCSIECRDKTIDKLTELQKKLIDECSLSSELPEIILKEPHCHPYEHKLPLNAEKNKDEDKKGEQRNSKCILS